MFKWFHSFIRQDTTSFRCNQYIVIKQTRLNRQPDKRSNINSTLGYIGSIFTEIVRFSCSKGHHSINGLFPTNCYGLSLTIFLSGRQCKTMKTIRIGLHRKSEATYGQEWKIRANENKP